MFTVTNDVIVYSSLNSLVFLVIWYNTFISAEAPTSFEWMVFTEYSQTTYTNSINPIRYRGIV